MMSSCIFTNTIYIVFCSFVIMVIVLIFLHEWESCYSDNEARLMSVWKL